MRYPEGVSCSHSGVITGRQKENIIPATAELRTSIRTFNPEVRARVVKAVERMARAESLASGADEPEIENYHYSNSVVNDEAVSVDLAQVLLRS